LPRRLGQHFLYQQPVLARIAAACCPSPPEPSLIEIGPGPGTLTAELLPLCSRLTAVELDSELAARLRVRFASDTRLSVIEGDVLQQDFGPYAPAVVCGNIPYYITSPIIEKALSLGPALVRAVFLIQREVANRLAASPNTRDYGYLTVVTQVQCRVERLFIVKPSAFRPPPKVDSVVISLTPHLEPLIADLPAFRRFAAACFKSKRKTLRNNLSSLYPSISATPEAGARAEQLPLNSLLRLFHLLHSSPFRTPSR
jgi:16S rRNA (adenine1518-N6/adenine1519-N6)-dimethyltransferase